MAYIFNGPESFRLWLERHKYSQQIPVSEWRGKWSHREESEVSQAAGKAEGAPLKE